MEIKNKEKTYKKSNSCVYSCQYHVIFCPKYRRSVLVDGVDERLKEIIFQKQKEYDYEIIEIEVMPDHVHILIDVNPDIGIAKVVKKIKGFSSNILRKEFTELVSKLPTLWTRSKFISTVGSVSLDVVKQYIENQKNR